MTRKLTTKSLARMLGLDYNSLNEFQKSHLQNECNKQQWLKTLYRQGFVRARWRGQDILPKDQIGDE